MGLGLKNFICTFGSFCHLSTNCVLLPRPSPALTSHLPWPGTPVAGSVNHKALFEGKVVSHEPDCWQTFLALGTAISSTPKATLLFHWAHSWCSWWLLLSLLLPEFSCFGKHTEWQQDQVHHICSKEEGEMTVTLRQLICSESGSCWAVRDSGHSAHLPAAWHNFVEPDISTLPVFLCNHSAIS